MIAVAAFAERRTRWIDEKSSLTVQSRKVEASCRE